MKKLVLIAGFCLATVLAYGQKLEKGNLVGLHVVSFDYQPGVTEDQLVKYMLEVYIPASSKVYGDKSFLLKGIRGEYAGKFAMISIFNNEQVRDQYWDNNGSTDAGKKAEESLKEVMDGLNKLATNFSSVYNDYLILNGTGESFQKGNLIGVHIAVPALKAGVTIDQYFEEYVAKAIPAYETNMKGIHVNLSRIIRGNNEAGIGYFAIFPDENLRDQYFTGETSSPKMQKANEQVNPVLEQLNEKYGSWETVYTDWVIL